MDDFISNINEYLKILNIIIEELNTEKEFTSGLDISNNKKNFIFIIGNTTCDMDSFISTLLLSVFKNFLYENKNILNKNLKNSKNIYFPIFNCKRSDFCDRLDIFYLLKKYQIETENLLFIDDEKIIEEFFFFEFTSLKNNPLCLSESSNNIILF